MGLDGGRFTWGSHRSQPPIQKVGYRIAERIQSVLSAFKCRFPFGIGAPLAMLSLLALLANRAFLFAWLLALSFCNSVHVSLPCI